MAFGLGSLVGGIVGGVAGISGGPAGIAAGFSIGTALGSTFDDDGSPILSGEGEALRAQQLELAKEREAEWQKVYGPIQSKLARNMRNMTVASVSALGLEGIEQEFETAGIAIREQVAQRGLEASGIESAFTARSEIAKAEAKAKVRAEAPEKIEAAQSRFLSLGLSQRDRQSAESTLLGQQASAADRRDIAQFQADQAEQAASARLVGDIAETVGTIAGKKTTPKKASVEAPEAPVLRSNSAETDKKFLSTGVA